MGKDSMNGTGAARCECRSDDMRETCTCSEASAKPAAKAPGKVVDFKKKTSEMRIKGTLTGSVSSLEATRALAFGFMHLKGEGVVRDPAKAASFLTTAAKGGSAMARHELAQLHLEGAHVPYDADFAISLLKSAVEDDEYAPSAVALAELYIFGKHCPKDLEAALDLLYPAAGKNDPAAMYYLAYIYDKEPDYTNSFEAAYWYRRAAEHGHFKSQVRLAALYATGEGVPQCDETAAAFLEVALETKNQQDPRFLCWQGERFLEQPETIFVAEALIRAAAEQHHAPAQRLMLQLGLGKAQNE